jgi:hypothetical protein
MNSNLVRVGGWSLMAAGAANAVFWLMVIPIGTFAGAEAALHPLWNPAQWIHIFAALFTLLGLVGLVVRQGEKIGKLGLAGFALSLFGAGFYLADGILALVIFPIVAVAAPALIAVDGSISLSPAFIVFAVTSMMGAILLGLALLRGKIKPRWAVLFWIVGGILSNLPPFPFLMPALIAGGVMWGIGTIGLGRSLRS